jgi:hypothetical protein
LDQSRLYRRPFFWGRAFFWEDLSTNSGLIEGAFNYATDAAYAVVLDPTNNLIASVIPRAKLGNGNFVYVWSANGINYFGLSAINSIDPNGAIREGSVGSWTKPGVSVAQAYAIDSKLDDGYPQSGIVIAEYQNWDANNQLDPVWAAGPGVNGPSGTAATPGSATTCYDNGNVAGAQQKYSMSQNHGAGLNCGLSFRFQ